MKWRPLSSDIEHVHDVGMVHERRDAGLGQEHVDDLGVLFPARLQDLEHEILLEPSHGLLASQENLRHAAGGKMLDDGVAP
jgi:hypothetical protein